MSNNIQNMQIFTIIGQIEDMVENSPRPKIGGANKRVIDVEEMMDCWASIEHELKYKHDIANPELMQQELKHCSDQIASTDLSLSTLKELILTPNADPDANSNTSAGAEKPVASDCRGIPLG